MVNTYEARNTTKSARTLVFPFGVLAAFVLPLGTLSSAAQTPNAVGNIGFSAYSINGTNNATLTLTRGVTYLFNVSASGHPFWTKTVSSIGTGNPR